MSYEHAQAYLAGGAASVWDALLPDLSSVLHEAEVSGCTLALENIAVWAHDATGFFNAPANVRRLLEEVHSPALAATPGADLAKFRPGVTVRHPDYGLGRIVSIEGAGPNRKGKVAFAVGGERTFVLAKSPLRTIGG